VPGFQVCGLGANGDLCRIQGTSYASPHLAGAVALVMDAFPGLTPAEVVDLLFVTADDTGAPGTDSINGRGRLNVGRAFQPVGPLAVPLVAGVRAVEVHTPLGVSGAAFGDGLTRHTAAWSIVGFDNYRRTFPVELASNWISAPAGPAPMAEAPALWRQAYAVGGLRVQMALADDIAPHSFRLPVDRADLEQNPTRIDADLGRGVSMSFAAHGARTTHRQGGAVGHLDHVQSDLSLQVTHRLSDVVSFAFVSERGLAPERPMLSLRSFYLAQSPSERSATAGRAAFDFGVHRFEITAGRIEEDNGVLGFYWSDVLGQTPAGETAFSGVAWRYRPDSNFRIDLEIEHGVSRLASTGWLSIDAPIRTSSYALSIEGGYAPRWLTSLVDGEGAVTFTISQPLRVEEGRMSFMAPTATKYGRRSLRYEERSFEPVPSGRETRLGLRYGYFAGDSLSAFGEAIYVLEPGHIANAEADTVLRLGARLAW
jgi:hypothetical protein